MSDGAEFSVLPPLAPGDLLEAVARVVREVRAECLTATGEAVNRAELAAALDVSRAALADQADQLRAEFEDVSQRTLAGEEFEARLAAAVAGVVGEGHAERLETVAQRASALAAQVEGLADIVAGLEGELERIRDHRAGLADAVAALATPAPWAQGGIGYRARALVTHRGGLWVACEDTLEQPGTGGAWALVADGVAELAAGTGQPGELALEVTFASGRQVALAAPLPRWTARGLWAQDADYRRDDLVTFDGCTWLALADAPGAAPPSPGWQCLAMRGARGRRGEPGEPGAPGPAGPAGPRGPRGPALNGEPP